MQENAIQVIAAGGKKLIRVMDGYAAHLRLVADIVVTTKTKTLTMYKKAGWIYPRFFVEKGQYWQFYFSIVIIRLDRIITAN